MIVTWVRMPAILPPHIIQRLGNLAQAAGAHRLHKFGEDIASGQSRLLQFLQCLRRFIFILLVKLFQSPDLGCLFRFGGTHQFDDFREVLQIGIGVPERVDTYDGQPARMF